MEFLDEALGLKDSVRSWKGFHSEKRARRVFIDPKILEEIHKRVDPTPSVWLTRLALS